MTDKLKCGDIAFGTLREALAAGYRTGSTAMFRGYISRKINTDDQPVLVAGGTRSGELYYCCPNYSSTQYYYRIYLIPPKDEEFDKMAETWEAFGRETIEEDVRQ